MCIVSIFVMLEAVCTPIRIAARAGILSKRAFRMCVCAMVIRLWIFSNKYARGICSSAHSNNQIVIFIVAVCMCLCIVWRRKFYSLSHFSLQWFQLAFRVQNRLPSYLCLRFFFVLSTLPISKRYLPLDKSSHVTYSSCLQRYLPTKLFANEN